MNAQRVRSRAPTATSFSQRASLENSLHPTVDSILKDLKTCSRRLQAALASYQDEMQVLERLYYRSKNQHRAALFFKRISEIRRYGWRLLEVNMTEDVHILRASFYGATVVQSEKLMRGSWNHVPSRSYVSFIAERFKAYSGLILRTSERVREAYYHFALAMQSGAFIQLIVLFAGLSSRMATLLTELGDCVRDCESACDRVLSVIDPAHKASFIAGSGTSKPTEHPLSDQSDQPVPAIDPNVPSEDFGSAVSRGDTVDLPSSTPVGAGVIVKNNTVSIDFDPLQASVVVEKVAVTKLSTRKDRIATKRKISSAPADQGRSKKLREKRDEIDDIFGF
ncbi:hypothetical protein DEU56DRAFT_762864 [Suillus clintonianus]|uniref:uncharacterized protein n=1 Tax=Suillus clintonianus TaxID=1904413 RepID=UPI001B873A20|nr:uncharacterized protein DEU56DRAFT_762864 [Suillus clintonianus]KAG2157060.1 hypothetical protein DEU56DRAFT_762864 [Suillus clintonianus]